MASVVVAVFTVINAVLLQPLDIPQSDELVSSYHRDTRGAGTLSSMSFPNYAYYRDNASSLAGLTAFLRLPKVVRTGERPEHVVGDLVASNYFSVLRVEPFLGRTFTPRDDKALGADPSVVLSYEYWRRVFAADPAIAGKAIRVHRNEFTVIGIAPPGFRWEQPPPTYCGWFWRADCGLFPSAPFWDCGLNRVRAAAGKRPVPRGPVRFGQLHPVGAFPAGGRRSRLAHPCLARREIEPTEALRQE